MRECVVDQLQSCCIVGEIMYDSKDTNVPCSNDYSRLSTTLSTSCWPLGSHRELQTSEKNKSENDQDKKKKNKNDNNSNNNNKRRTRG